MCTGGPKKASNSSSSITAGIIGISPSPVGTALAQQHLRVVLATLDMPTLGQPEMFLQMKDDFFDESGNTVGNGHGGYLVIDKPWPSMMRGIWKEPKRYEETYWSKYKGVYFVGDGAKLDKDGAIWLLGRVDDVMNVSGHRISTTEVESALVSHEEVAEAAVVGANDATTGQAIVAFVILRGGIDHTKGEALISALKAHVVKEIGAIARPRQILVVNELPKTRSGKIMRRLLRDVAENRAVGDSTTLADPNVMNLIKDGLATATED